MLTHFYIFLVVHRINFHLFISRFKSISFNYFHYTFSLQHKAEIMPRPYRPYFEPGSEAEVPRATARNRPLNARQVYSYTFFITKIQV